MAEENPLGGRLTLALVGAVLTLIGTGTVAYPVAYPTVSLGLLEIVGAVAFVGVGVVAVGAAVVDPDGLEIGTRVKPSEAEKRERRYDDP